LKDEITIERTRIKKTQKLYYSKKIKHKLGLGKRVKGLKEQALRIYKNVMKQI
jgi:hypothetical protein